MAVNRIAVERIAPERISATRNGVSKQTGSRSQTFADKKRQEARDSSYIENVKKNISSFSGTISNINNLDSELRNYMNRNLSNVPFSLQGKFKQLIQEARNDVIKKQNALKSQLENSVKVYKQREEYFSSKDNYAIADKYYAQMKEAQRQLNSLNAGNIKTTSSVYSDITSIGKKAQKEKSFRLTKNAGAVNKYIDNAYKSKLESVSQIKDRFGVSLSRAKEIRKEVQDKQVEFLTGEKTKISKTESTQEKIKKSNKQIESFVSSIGLDFFDRYIKTNASFPKNIQNARSIFLGELKSNQVKQLNKLSNEQKQVILNYSVLKSINKLLPKQTYSTTKDLNKILKKRGVELSKEDANLLLKIGLSEDINLLKMAKSDINRYIRAYNKLLSREEVSLSAKQEAFITEIRKDIGKLILNIGKKSKPYNNIFEIPAEILKNPFNAFKKQLDPSILLMSLEAQKLKFLDDYLRKSQRDGTLTEYEINYWRKAIKDMTGLKAESKRILNKSNEEFKKFIDTIKIDLSGKKRTTASYPNKIQKARALFLNEFTPAEQKKFDKKAITLASDYFKKAKNITKNALKIAINDWKDLAIAIFKLGKKVTFDDGVKLGNRFATFILGERRTLTEQKRDLLNITKALRTAGYSLAWIRENPELVSLAISVGAVNLLKTSRDTLKKNPEKWWTNVLSFYIDGWALKGVGKAGKIAKVAKIKLSPFVLRNINIFNEGASMHVGAKALTSLEGKTVDLFSATAEGLLDIFKKSTPITEKEARVLIKDMLRNPMNYIGENLKIKPLETIIKSKPKGEILNFMKKNKDGILTGSGGLSLQLGKWRKVGDLDILVKSPQKFAYSLLDHLNNKNFLGKILNRKRFKVKKLSNVDVYRIWDSGFKGRRKYNSKWVIADIDGIAGYEQQFLRTGKLKPSDIRKIGGVNVLKAEAVLPRKAELVLQATKARRYEKELKDLKLLMTGLDKKINKKEYNTVKKLLDSEKGLLKVRGFADNLSMKRKWGWAEELLGDLKLRFVGIYDSNPKRRKWARAKDKEVYSKLKKIGLTDRDINKAINALAPNDMYFAPNMMYSYYLTHQGRLKRSAGVIIARDIKISSYPKNLQGKIKKHISGLLNKQESTKLANDLRSWRTSNPDKFFIGQEAIKDRAGELEILLSEFSKLYAKKYFITREIYVPVLDKFVKAQEVLLKKPTKKTIKMLYGDLQNKLKKGYTVSDMKKDISTWIKKNKDKIELGKKKAIEITKAQEAFLQKEIKRLDNKISEVSKLDIPNTEKQKILSDIRREKRFFTKAKTKRYDKVFLTKRASRAINNIRKSVRTARARKIPVRAKKPIKRTPKSPIKRAMSPTRTVKKIKRAQRRIPKRTVVRPVDPRKIPTRIPSRPITRVRKPIKRIPRRPIKDAQPKKIKLPRLNKPELNWDSKPSGYERVVNVVIRVKGKNKELKWLTTPNKALKRISKLVDNTTARSFKLKIVGLKKADDIKMPNLSKFRTKKSKGSPVLNVVEKSINAIDTLGEKRGLTIAKALSKQKTKKKVSKNGTNGSSTTKRSNGTRKLSSKKKKQSKVKKTKKTKKKK